LNFIDIAIFILSLGGLIYLVLDRIIHSNINVFRAKFKRSSELDNLINDIEADCKDTLEQIKNTDLTEPLDPVFIDKLVKYRDNEYYLKILKKEQSKIEIWLKNSKFSTY